MTVLGQAQEFAERLEDTIRNAFPGEVSVRARTLATTGRILIAPVVPRGNDRGQLPKDGMLDLFGDGVALARWKFSMFAEASVDGFLKIDEQRISLTPAFEQAPVARLEYESRSSGPPVSHWQFHGERGSLSFILARTRRSGKAENIPMSLSALHFPTGGRRFRPGIEDFIQFLIRDCGFDSNPSWQSAVEDGREISRRFQVRTVARDYQAEVAEVLREKGWTVRPPHGFVSDEAVRTLREY